MNNGKSVIGTKSGQGTAVGSSVSNAPVSEAKGAGEQEAMLIVKSTRFGEVAVPAASELFFPSGVIGFPEMKRYVILEHKPPFSWLHSLDDPSLAFVIVDGAQFGENYQVKAPIGDTLIDLRDGDDFALLVIVTVRPDPTLTTANLKAPLFVNVRNRKGMQIIFDDPRYSTRFSLWSPQGDEEGHSTEGDSEEAEENQSELGKHEK